MSKWTLPHLSDEAFEQEFHASVRRNDESTAVMVARLAEFEERKRHLPAGYATMWDYCRLYLEWSKDVSKNRLQAAGTARNFPAIFDLLAQGKLDLSGIRLLAPHLTKENAAELLAQAADRSKREIELVIRPRTTASPEPLAEGNPRIPQQTPGAPGRQEPGAATFELESPDVAAPEPSTTDVVPLHLHIDRETQ